MDEKLRELLFDALLDALHVPGISKRDLMTRTATVTDAVAPALEAYFYEVRKSLVGTKAAKARWSKPAGNSPIGESVAPAADTPTPAKRTRKLKVLAEPEVLPPAATPPEPEQIPIPMPPPPPMPTPQAPTASPFG